tara:strand:- start:4392 stop:4820 length:429 start_codon:yes stop_codon:yes gene_type:complete
MNSETYSKILNHHNNSIRPTYNIRYSTTQEYLNNNWTILRLNKDTMKPEIINSQKYIETKAAFDKKQYGLHFNKYLNTLIHNWDTFRNTENELRGDLSPYTNYKKEIIKMVEEDTYIAETVNNYYNLQKNDDSDYYSDEENK